MGKLRLAGANSRRTSSAPLNTPTAVPVAPVASGATSSSGTCSGEASTLAQDVRLFGGEEGLQPRLARANAVHVPGRDSHGQGLRFPVLSERLAADQRQARLG
jgi:hypothetical protein